MHRRTYAVIVGLMIGISAGLIGLLLAVGGPLIAAGALFGLLAALYLLTDLSAALYGMVFIVALIPFAAFPVKIGFTPTFLDAGMAAFLIVYAAQWMTGKRRGFRLTPIHGLVAIYMGWLIFSFLLGLRWARPTSADLRQFAEMLLSLSMVFILGDVLRDTKALRRFVLVLLLALSAQAMVSLTLYAMPDDLAERTLVRLARFGYPDGGVIRYIEDNPALDERAIGTWVDPNALGGFLAVLGVFMAPQVFARKPILRWRWLLYGLLGIAAVALVLTYSRASLLAAGIGLTFIGIHKGYRRFLLVLGLGAILIFILPQTQGVVERLLEAFTGSDLATQMRIGEYGDAFELIQRYPITGVGFTGTPSIDLYTDVASMYLIMANQIGLVGVGLFGLTMGGVFIFGRKMWPAASEITGQRAIHLGAHAALLAALVNATADLYFFRTDFHASITLFWLVVTAALVSSRLASERSALPPLAD
ncbi:MAG: O-antigen ligase family protein [Anaerolineae bacterium]